MRSLILVLSWVVFSGFTPQPSGYCRPLILVLKDWAFPPKPTIMSVDSIKDAPRSFKSAREAAQQVRFKLQDFLMYVRMNDPEMATAAYKLLKGYSQRRAFSLSDLAQIESALIEALRMPYAPLLAEQNTDQSIAAALNAKSRMLEIVAEFPLVRDLNGAIESETIHYPFVRILASALQGDFALNLERIETTKVIIPQRGSLEEMLLTTPLEATKRVSVPVAKYSYPVQREAALRLLALPYIFQANRAELIIALKAFETTKPTIGTEADHRDLVDRLRTRHNLN